MTEPLLLVVMGVSGAGKTTLGLALAERLGLPFEDADRYHSPANVAKMAKGEPLSDEDRAPWLVSVQAVIRELLQDKGGVVACSALKQSYRDQLALNPARVVFVHLNGSFRLIEERLRQRTGHFMGSGLLESQFAALEQPSNAIKVDATEATSKQVEQVLGELAARKRAEASSSE